MLNQFKSASVVFAFLLIVQLCHAQKTTRQTEHLKKFPDCFSIIAGNDAQKQIVSKILADPPCFRQCLITNYSEYLLLAFFPRAMEDQLKQCYFSQANIIGAIKMYNNENLLPLRRINDSIISSAESPLIPDYLKFPFPRSCKNCRFESIGDITKGNLQIYCTFHGAPQRKGL